MLVKHNKNLTSTRAHLTAPLAMHVRRQSDEEPPVVRREVTSEIVAVRNRAADEVLAQIRGEKAKRTK